MCSTNYLAWIDGSTNRLRVMGIALLLVVSGLAIFFQMKRFAMNDAESQATLRVLAEFHSTYVNKSEGDLKKYIEELRRLQQQYDYPQLKKYIDDHYCPV